MFHENRRKLGKMLQNLLSVAVVIGSIRVKFVFCAHILFSYQETIINEMESFNIFSSKVYAHEFFHTW